jgi:hypothetical protein
MTPCAAVVAWFCLSAACSHLASAQELAILRRVKLKMCEIWGIARSKTAQTKRAAACGVIRMSLHAYPPAFVLVQRLGQGEHSKMVSVA